MVNISIEKEQEKIKKEIKNCKCLIIFCMCSLAFISGNFVFGVIQGKLLSIIVSPISAIVMAWCIMRNVETISQYRVIYSEFEYMKHNI